MKHLYSKIFLFLFIAIGASDINADGLYSQYVITPTATDLGKYGDIPVSYYTGQANVSVPIYSTKQLGVPFQIGLSYDGAGYLVNKLPGWTGHNWTLSAGGVITRVENGQADECDFPEDLLKYNYYDAPIEKGFFHTYKYLNQFLAYAKEQGKEPTAFTNPGDKNSCVQNFLCGDTQPDIFYFNFCGLSGRFFLGNDGKWKVLSDNNITVEFDFNNDYILPFIEKYPNDNSKEQPKTIKGFTLIDENGTRYTFGGTTDAIEYSIPISGIGYEGSHTGHSWHASAWYLTQIADRFGNKLYSFKYERGYFVTHASYRLFDTSSWGNTSGSLGVFSGLSFCSDKFRYSFSISAPTYLSEVTTLDGTTIVFKSDTSLQTDRNAYPSLYGKYNGSGFFRDHYKDIIGKVDNSFRYYYLREDDSQSKKYRYPTDSSYYDPFKATGLKCLDSIIVKINGVPTNKYAFVYNNKKAPKMHIEEMRMTDGKDGNIQSYKFAYNRYEELPDDYLTTNSDDWGYFNSDCEAGSLKQIEYPTGGKAVFEYERNTYSKYLKIGRQVVEELKSDSVCGGIRVKSISTFDSSDLSKPSSKREFVYENENGCSSGELASKPIYRYEWNPTNGNKSTMHVYTTSISSVIPLQTSFGPHVGYSRVIEKIDGAETIYEYTNFSNTKKDCPYLYRYQEVTPYDKYGEVGYRRGKLFSVTLKDKNGKIVTQKINKYRSDNSEKDYVIACNKKQESLANNVNFQYVTGGFYQLFYPKYDIESITERNYLEDGKTYIESITTLNKKDYDGMRFVVSEEKKWNTKGVESKRINEKIQYDYVFDLFAKKKIIRPSEMKNLRMIYDDISDEEFEKILKERREPNGNYLYYDSALFCKQHFYPLANKKIFYNETMVDSVYTRYDLYDNRLSPACTISKGDTLTQYLSYNNLGLPTQIKQLGRPVSKLDWNQEKIQSIVTTGLKDYKFNQNDIAKKADTEAYLVKYNNLNQISSITEPSGITQKYEYDLMGRLSAIKDHNEIKMSSISYHVNEDGHNYVKTQAYPDSAYGTIIQYYDGLGRPTLLASNERNTNQYIYSMQEYDSMGRVFKTWNPLPGGNQPEEKSLTSFISSSESFYSDSAGYSLSEYDVLGRVVKTTRSGNLWHNNGISSRNQYGFNVKGDSIRHYNYMASGTVLGYDQYAQGDLSYVVSVNEDGMESIVYKDNLGNTVLERRKNGKEKLDTYFVYDNKGRLAWVLQPMYQINPDNEKYAFQYTYNDKDQLISKKIPGCESVQYWYDENNRVIRMCDGVLKKANKYRTYTYDSLGRLTNQSICLSDFTKEYDEIVHVYDSISIIDRSKRNLVVLDPNGFGIGQITATCQRTSNGDEILTTFTYDEYGRVAKTEELGLDNHLTTTEMSYNFVGDVTRSKLTECVLSGSNSKLLLEAVVENTYAPHTKLPVSSLLYLTSYKDGICHRKDTITMQDLSYNALGQVLANNRDGNAGDISYAYDLLHGWVTGINTGAGFEQKMYREANSAHPRWDGSISAMAWSTDGVTIRRYDYDYDKLNRMTKAEYSETFNGSAERRNISWDAEGNIIILPASSSQSFGNKYGEFLSYDRNSNISSLRRYGMLNDKTYGIIDNLDFSYNGNQRTKVTDAETESLTYTGSFDFEDGTNTGDDYSYNANGALVMDRNKGITNIEYDLLGNPRKVSMSNDCSIEYVYAADGRRLRTVHKKTTTVITILPPKLRTTRSTSSITRKITHSETTSYHGNLILQNGKPQMYRFAGGYYNYNDDGSLGDAHYYIQDYLGNNRMVVNASTDEVEQVNHYYPYGGLIGDLCTGQSEQVFKFGDKKLDRTYGLDLYDFEARQYDAIAPWFTSIDPLAEKYYSISPYAYCAGDPVNLVDPTGMSTQVVLDSVGNYTVIGGNIDDGDRNIYIMAYDEEGNLCSTRLVLGKTPTMTSFYDSKNDKWKGVIDPEDNSGIDFLSSFMEDTPFLHTYGWNARNFQRYDFKSTNGTESVISNDVNYYYRGMPIGNGKNGSKIYTSAREIGNIAAGYCARKNGLSWEMTRFLFDGYQSYPSLRYHSVMCYNGVSTAYLTMQWTPEELSTQNAEKYGFNCHIKIKKYGR